MDKKINIAICLSTEPRFWENAANSISDFINLNKDKCQIDVFYHLWDDVTCQYPAKPRDVKLTDDPIIRNVDPATLQHHFKPTVGICESKDNLNPHIDEAWEYVQSLRHKHTITDASILKYLLQCTPEELKAANMSIKDAFYAAIKKTSRMKFSQIISMCKSLILMSDYAEENNIYYDVIIRSRTDIHINSTKFGKIQTLVQRDRLSRYIYFTELAVRTPDDGSPNSCTPYAVFDFFVSSSNIINKDLFKDYTKRIIELLFLVKKNCQFEQRSIHNCVPLFLKQHRREIVLNGKISPFSWSFKKSKAAPSPSINPERVLNIW